MADLVEKYGEFFVRRLDKWEPILGFIGKRPAVEAKLRDADRRVVTRLEELVEAVGASWTGEDLADLGARWARGELKASTVAGRISSAAGVRDEYGTARVDHVVAGAVGELRTEADNDELAPGVIATEVGDLLREAVEEGLREAAEAWSGLPEWLQREVFSESGDGYRFENLTAKLDLERDSEEAILAAKRMARAARQLTKAIMPDVEGPEDFERAIKEFTFLKHGISEEAQRDYFGNLREGATTVDTDVLFVECTELNPVWGPSEDLVAKGVDEFSVLVDPLGDDKEEYERRAKLVESVRYFRDEFEYLRDLRASAPGSILPPGLDWDELRRRSELRGDELISEWKRWRAGELKSDPVKGTGARKRRVV